MSTEMKPQGPQRTQLQVINDHLTSKVEQIELMLPEALKGKGERYLRRACLTVASGSDQLKKCTASSIAIATLKAAEFGLPIDGRLAHLVPYNNKKKDVSGKEYWVYEAQFQPDYKGIVAVARRLKLIQDAYARVVYENDVFSVRETDGETFYDYEPILSDGRGHPVSVFAVAILGNGLRRFDWDTWKWVISVRNRSKAKDSGPWVTDQSEMAKKSILKRLLKTITDDADFMSLVDSENDEYQSMKIENKEPTKRLESLTHKLKSKPVGHIPFVGPDVEHVERVSEEKPSQKEPPKKRRRKSSKPEPEKTEEKDEELQGWVGVINETLALCKTIESVESVYENILKEAKTSDQKREAGIAREERIREIKNF